MLLEDVIKIDLVLMDHGLTLLLVCPINFLKNCLTILGMKENGMDLDNLKIKVKN